ncbi:MAG TPA: ABC transporter substrate-binding protein [Chloroflexota bacterium]|jgi:ABC-type nitrate/sulfonate/bicarbonate transport system substrate-binding protein
MRPLRLITFGADAGLVAARAQGVFSRHDIALEVTETPNSTVQMRGLGQGEYDVASTAFDNVLAWSGRDGGPEIVAVLQPNAGQMLPMYVRPEIKDWTDLRGKPLAADAVDTAFALVLRRILLAHDLDLDRGDYTLVALGNTQARLASMQNGATFAGMMSTQLEAQAQRAGMVRLADHREVLPDYPGGVFAVARGWGDTHRELVGDFLRAWLEGARWVQANREAAVDLLVREQQTTREAAAESGSFLSADGAFNVPGLQSVLDLRTRFGFKLPMGADLARYHDSSYYQQVVQGS